MQRFKVRVSNRYVDEYYVTATSKEDAIKKVEAQDEDTYPGDVLEVGSNCVGSEVTDIEVMDEED